MAKLGRAYEQVVAEILRAMDPGAKVTDGEWVVGPDGRRDRDVTIEGSVAGVTRRGLVECKDFNPKTTGRVGIGYVDALDSKRRDLAADFTFICSNAGFTVDAMNKARRVGIGLISVMRRGDSRVRFRVTAAMYTRKIAVTGFNLSLRGPAAIDHSQLGFLDPRFENLPIGNWVVHRATTIIATNPVVCGTISATHDLIETIDVQLPKSVVEVSGIDFSFSITGGWYEHNVTMDSTGALFDWLRHRIRPAPGGGQLVLHDFNFEGGRPIPIPPAHGLGELKSYLEGEIGFMPMVITGIDLDLPAPNLDRLIQASDKDATIPDLTADLCTSTPSKRAVRRKAKH